MESLQRLAFSHGIDMSLGQRQHKEPIATVKVSKRFQIVIPAEIREQLQPGAGSNSGHGRLRSCYSDTGTLFTSVSPRPSQGNALEGHLIATTLIDFERATRSSRLDRIFPRR